MARSEEKPVPSRPAPALPNLGSNNQEATHANAGGGKLRRRHPPPPRAPGRQRGGETRDGRLSRAPRSTGGRKPAFAARRMLVRRPRQEPGVEGAAGERRTPPRAAVSCAGAGRRRGEEAPHSALVSRAGPRPRSRAVSFGFWGSYRPAAKVSPAPCQFPGEAASPT